MFRQTGGTGTNSAKRSDPVSGRKHCMLFSHMWIPSFNAYMYIIQGFSEWTQTTRLNRRPWKGQKGERACHVTDQGYPGV